MSWKQPVTELTPDESLQISIYKMNNFQLTYFGKELHLPSNKYIVSNC